MFRSGNPRIKLPLPPNVRVFASAFGLNHRQWKAIFAKQHIVAVAHLAHHTGHTLYRIFLLYICIGTIEFPAHELQIYVNSTFASGTQTNLPAGKIAPADASLSQQYIGLTSAQFVCASPQSLLLFHPAGFPAL